MGEQLDIYDEKGNPLGRELRSAVHEQGLWHKTVNLWVLRPGNKILFQMRSSSLRDNPSKLYTPASGHVLAGESVEDCLKREAAEELGIALDFSRAHFIEQGRFVADFTQTDGKLYRDRALYHIHFLEDGRDLTLYDFQQEELDGLYEFSLAEALELFQAKREKIPARGVIKQNGRPQICDATFTLADFLILSSETPMSKFGRIMKMAMDFLAARAEITDKS